MPRNVRAIAITTAALTIVGAGSALAYWTNTSRSSGTATVGTTSFEITAPSTLDPGLRPGNSQRYSFSITNTGTVYATATDVTFAIANANGTPWVAAGCGAADFTVGPVLHDSGVPFTSLSVAPGQQYVLATVVEMKDIPGVDQDGCKGKTLSLQVSVS